MNKLSTKIASGIATASLIGLAAAPLAFADTVVDVGGNGAFSDNTVKVSNENSTTLKQNNDTDITNKVNTYQNTGNNEANFNTGGSVTIRTGDADSRVNIDNQAGKNEAFVKGGSGSGDTIVDVAGNGAFSENTVKLNNSDSLKLKQNNDTDITNKVNTYQNTGNNEANFNTGTKVVIETGDADSKVNIDNQAGANFATVKNGRASNDTLVSVDGNGAFSENKVTIKDHANTYLSQNNDTRFTNYVKTFQTTGNNDASFNTGGSVTIKTGDTDSRVNIENEAGLNSLLLVGGYGSYNTTWVDVSGNGAFSDNKVKVYSRDSLKVYQNNDTYINNHVYTKQSTGKNDANFNTGKHKHKYFGKYLKHLKDSYGYKDKHGHGDKKYGRHASGRVYINTGDANSRINIDNEAGFNSLLVI